MDAGAAHTQAYSRSPAARRGLRHGLRLTFLPRPFTPHLLQRLLTPKVACNGGSQLAAGRRLAPALWLHALPAYAGAHRARRAAMESGPMKDEAGPAQALGRALAQELAQQCNNTVCYKRTIQNGPPLIRPGAATPVIFRPTGAPWPPRHRPRAPPYTSAPNAAQAPRAAWARGMGQAAQSTRHKISAQNRIPSAWHWTEGHSAVRGARCSASTALGNGGTVEQHKRTAHHTLHAPEHSVVDNLGGIVEHRQRLAIVPGHFHQL